MKNLIPDYVFSSIYEITPDFLIKNGVRGVLIDLDGTLASNKTAQPPYPQELDAFLKTLRDSGLRVLVFSNNHKRRVGLFCKSLDTEFMYWACKPMLLGFRRASKRLGIPLKALAVIGDQIFTDVLGGNRVGALTCYVSTLDLRSPWVNIRCRIERGFVERGKKRMDKEARHD